MSMERIEQLTRAHAMDRERIAALVGALNEEIEAAKRKRLKAIKAAVCAAKDSRLQLHAAIATHAVLFERPRSRVLHGLRVGLQKAKGKVQFESAERVVVLIRRHLPSMFDQLVETIEKPKKAALLDLPASELKRIGCEISGSGDQVLIKAADSEIEKLVSALLDGDSDEEDGE